MAASAGATCALTPENIGGFDDRDEVMAAFGRRRRSRGDPDEQFSKMVSGLYESGFALHRELISRTLAEGEQIVSESAAFFMVRLRTSEDFPRRMGYVLASRGLIHYHYAGIEQPETLEPREIESVKSRHVSWDVIDPSLELLEGPKPPEVENFGSEPQIVRFDLSRTGSASSSPDFEPFQLHFMVPSDSTLPRYLHSIAARD